jgi:hypothetical protein
MDHAMNRCCTASLMGLICPAATAATRADSATAPPSANELPRERVEINSTHAHGSTEAAKALAAHFLAAGFAAPDVAFLAPTDHPSKVVSSCASAAARDGSKSRRKPMYAVATDSKCLR